MSIDLPTARRVGAWPVGTPDWHAARANGLGGSEIAAVLGLSKWESPFSLWHRKAGRIPEPTLSSEMEAGTLLEPVILNKWESKQDGKLFLLNPGAGPSATYCHTDRPWQIANPDGIAVRDPRGGLQVVKGVEAKFALYDDEWGAEGTDEIPPYYLAQVRWYMDTLGLDEFDVEVFIGSQGQFRTYTIRADDTDQAFMRQRAQEFLNTLPGGPNEHRPNIDTHGATYQAVRALHPNIDDVTIELPTSLVRAYCNARTAVKDAEAACQQATSLIADAMGNAKKAEHLGQVIARRQAKGENGTPYIVAARNLPNFQKEAA